MNVPLLFEGKVVVVVRADPTDTVGDVLVLARDTVAPRDAPRMQVRLLSCRDPLPHSIVIFVSYTLLVTQWRHRFHCMRLTM